MILDEIAAETRERIAEKSKEIPLSEVRSEAERMRCLVVIFHLSAR